MIRSPVDKWKSTPFPTRVGVYLVVTFLLCMVAGAYGETSHPVMFVGNYMSGWAALTWFVGTLITCAVAVVCFEVYLVYRPNRD